MKTQHFLKLFNRALYIGSAVLLITALFLSVAVQPAQAATLTGGGGQSPRLELSHIACVNNKVEVHFVVNNLGNYESAGNLTFKLKINNGTEQVITISSSSHNNGTYQYNWYGTVNGYYNVTEAQVYTSYHGWIDLKNPGAYNYQNNQCVASTPTKTSVPPTATKTSVPPTPTKTNVPPTATFTPTNTSVPPTFTPTFTPTSTEVPPTFTATFTPTSTDEPQPTPTDTEVPQPTPTSTDIVPTPTNTEESPTETPIPPTETTPDEPTSTPETPVPTSTNPPVVLISAPLLEVDPFCTVDGQMQWTVVNPNADNVYIEHYTVDGSDRSGFSAAPGEHDLTQTPLGTHSVTLFYNDAQTVSLSYTINVCPLPVPVTGNAILIPVTGADNSGALTSGLFFGGSSLAGLALVLSALRKFLKL